MTAKKAEVRGEKLCLVSDEIDSVRSRTGKWFPFRIRIWRQVDHAAVVLVSQAAGGPPPNWMQTRIANYVWRALLRYPADGMYYFLDYREAGRRKLDQVTFDVVGEKDRGALYQPLEIRRTWEFVETLVGDRIER